jgi:hypothetical protein
MYRFVEQELEATSYKTDNHRLFALHSAGMSRHSSSTCFIDDQPTLIQINSEHHCLGWCRDVIVLIDLKVPLVALLY